MTEERKKIPSTCRPYGFADGKNEKPVSQIELNNIEDFIPEVKEEHTSKDSPKGESRNEIKGADTTSDQRQPLAPLSTNDKNLCKTCGKKFKITFQ